MDRIAEPWGSRTRYGPAETWPVRVRVLGDGVDEADVDRWALTASIPVEVDRDTAMGHVVERSQAMLAPRRGQGRFGFAS